MASVRGSVVALTVDHPQVQYPLRAVDRVCDLIDILAGAPDGLPLPALASATGLPRSSAFRYLAALESRGYVDRIGDGTTYRLGLLPGPTRADPAAQLDRLTSAAVVVLAQAKAAIGGVIILGVRSGRAVRPIWADPNAHIPDWLPWSGESFALHSSALGKTMLAQLTDQQVRDLADQAGLPGFTAHTLTSTEALLRELHRVRGDGFAVDRQETFTGVHCVAVGLVGDGLVASVAVADQPDRLSLERIPAVARVLRRAAVTLSRELRMPGKR